MCSVQAQPVPQMRNLSCKAEIVDDIKNKIAFVAGGDPNDITEQDIYAGAANSVREKLFDEFNKTNKYFEYAVCFSTSDHASACPISGSQQACWSLDIYDIPSRNISCNPDCNYI